MIAYKRIWQKIQKNIHQQYLPGIKNRALLVRERFQRIPWACARAQTLRLLKNGLHILVAWPVRAKDALANIPWRSLKTRWIRFYYNKKDRLLAKLHTINRQDIKVRCLAYGQRISWKSTHVLMSGVLILFIGIAGLLYLNTTANVTVVSVNGQNIGFADSNASAQSMLAAVLDKNGQSVSQTAKTHDDVQFDQVRVKKKDWVAQKLSEQDLEKCLHMYVEGARVTIEDQTLLVLADLDAANQVLETFKNQFVQPTDTNIIESVRFIENVQVSSAEVSPSEVKTAEEAMQLLQDGKTTTEVYTVQLNDSWWLIARKNDMKTQEVLAGNPGYNEDSSLRAGQQIHLVSNEPYIKVAVTGAVTLDVTIPFDVETKTDTSLGSGAMVVQQEGLDGSKSVTYAYEQENGKDIKKTVIAETVIQEPKTQIVAKGPARATTVAMAGTSRGSGSVSGLALIWPIQGPFTSYYGYRASGFHTGIDIDGDTGDPFVAAAGGSVVSAGWNGSYGYTIVIDHGNGVATRYAHASKLLVSGGQSVSKGEVIGLVGSTGNSTGPHMHFEIIINGDTVNPLNYMR
ncbi:MAG: peptidoglycan DD-metalloendopeptidase family protein [Peptococcaceae bacterium]|nr:peptidoglycan DD-metalloendopeptidase family protein [Peptococcaceae bacterium]